MINEVFKNIEASMALRLAEVRTKFANTTNKGSTLETAFREFLSEYLPRTYGVSHGEIIDSHGGRSPQMDVVVTHDYHPFTFGREGAGIFLVEGVAAIGEVKSVLTSEELKRSIAASKKTKALRKKVPDKSKFVVPYGFDGRYLATPPYFIFAYESQLSLKAIGNALAAETHCEKDVEGTKFVDAVFVLGKGAVVNFWKDAALKALDSEGNTVDGFVCFNDGDAIRPLMDWLYLSMHKIQYSRPMLLSYTGVEIDEGNRK